MEASKNWHTLWKKVAPIFLTQHINFTFKINHSSRAWMSYLSHLKRIVSRWFFKEKAGLALKRFTNSPLKPISAWTSPSRTLITRPMLPSLISFRLRWWDDPSDYDGNDDDDDDYDEYDENYDDDDDGAGWSRRWLCTDNRRLQRRPLHPRKLHGISQWDEVQHQVRYKTKQKETSWQCLISTHSQGQGQWWKRQFALCYPLWRRRLVVQRLLPCPLDRDAHRHQNW